MAEQATVVLQVNDLRVDWDDSTRRVEKPCFKCGKATRGRAKNQGGIVKPACMNCALGEVIVQAQRFYKAMR